jgi:predicted ATPase
MNVLVTGAPDAAPRHRTLIETIGWSHDLLAPIERKLFRRLALFAEDGRSMQPRRPAHSGTSMRRSLSTR